MSNDTDILMAFFGIGLVLALIGAAIFAFSFFGIANFLFRQVDNDRGLTYDEIVNMGPAMSICYWGIALVVVGFIVAESGVGYLVNKSDQTGLTILLALAIVAIAETYILFQAFKRLRRLQLRIPPYMKRGLKED